MPEFVVLGARGQLAQAFLRDLGPRAQGLTRHQLALGAQPSQAGLLVGLHPQVVINCAAYNHVDGAESQHLQALDANARGPAQLAALAAAQGFRLVHFSTDYVFGADPFARPRIESNPPAPLNFYGYSKLLGEQAVLQMCPQALVLRVAHLFGGHSRSPGRASLADRFVALARARQPITITRGQRLNPTSVRDVIPATLALLARGATGLFHLTGEGDCSAAQFAEEACRLAGVRPQLRYVTRDARPARRARTTVLANQHLASLGLPPLPHWRTSLADALQAAVR